jgi:coenzyme Q-binding protein COQ10
MNRISTHRRVRHPWSHLFDLVVDLERYPEFVPYCQKVHVLARRNQGPDKRMIVSRMTVGVSAIRVSYVNRTVAAREERRITVDAADGPLQSLRCLWQFTPDGDEWTEVSFKAAYKFSNPVLAMTASRMFDATLRQTLDAFARRADQLSARALKPIAL